MWPMSPFLSTSVKPISQASSAVSDGGASDADLLGVDETLAFNEIGGLGYGGAMTADQGYAAPENADRRRQAK